MNISKVLEETEQFEAEYNEHKISFKATRASLTPSFIQNISKVTDYPKAVASAVKDWDVTSDDEGTKWPLDEDSLGRLPVALLSTILDRIGESWGGDAKKPESSPNGLAAAGK